VFLKKIKTLVASWLKSCISLKSFPLLFLSLWHRKEVRLSIIDNAVIFDKVNICFVLFELRPSANNTLLLLLLLALTILILNNFSNNNIDFRS
jgi:hypothetical protein